MKCLKIKKVKEGQNKVLPGGKTLKKRRVELANLAGEREKI